MSEDGFYFVKLSGEGVWRIAELEDGKWWIIGSADSWRGEDLDIGSKINLPE